MPARRRICFFCLVMMALLTAAAGVGARSVGPNHSPPVADLQPQDGIELVIQAFDRHPIVALGELHGSEQVHDFLLKLVRDERLPAKTRTVVVEFGSARFQKVIDRYLRGEPVSPWELARVWRNTSQLMVWDSPVYERFFAAVREVNRTRPRSRRLRVLLADPPIDWERIHSAEEFSAAFTRHGGDEARDRHPARLLAERVLKQGDTALVVMGVMHVLHRQSALGSVGVVELVEKQRPGSAFVMVPHHGFSKDPPAYEPRLSTWTSGTVARLQGTWLGALRMDAVFPWLERDLAAYPRFDEMADALLYLGPVASLKVIGARLSTYEDVSYLSELERRDRIATRGYYAPVLAQIRQRHMQRPRSREDRALPQPRLRTERFDRDPGWEGVRNRVASPPARKAQSFGYQPGAIGQRYGRIGGTVWRSVKSAYYGMPLQTLTLDDRLTASGTLALTGAKTTVGYQNGSTIFIGFFNSKERGWRPVNFAGFRLEGYNEPDGATLEVTYGTRAWTAGGSFVNTAGGAQERNVRDLDSGQLRRVAPDGVKHRWSLDYDPSTSVISFTFDGKVSTQALRPEHRKQGAEMNRFGLFNAELPGNEMTAFLDDLTVNGRRIDLAQDPKWEGRNNRATYVANTGYGINDFGYSRKAGTVGGRFWRVQEPDYMAYYGRDIGRLTMDDPLCAAGRISIPRFSIDSGMHVGWFNSREQGWPPKNFIGVYLDSLSSAGRFITPMYGTSRARRERIEGRYRLFGAAHGSEEVLFYPNGRWYEWALKYDPAASGGNGAITLWLGDQMQTVPLAPGVRKEGALMDRFGVFNMQDNNGKDCVVYLDDLRYTTSKSR